MNGNRDRKMNGGSRQAWLHFCKAATTGRGMPASVKPRPPVAECQLLQSRDHRSRNGNLATTGRTIGTRLIAGPLLFSPGPQEVKHHAHQPEDVADSAQDVVPSRLLFVLGELLTQLDDLPGEGFHPSLEGFLARGCGAGFVCR